MNPRVPFADGRVALPQFSKIRYWGLLCPDGDRAMPASKPEGFVDRNYRQWKEEELSSTCPRMFRERRRKVAAAILHEVISYSAPLPLPSQIRCYFLHFCSTSRFSFCLEKGRNIARPSQKSSPIVLSLSPTLVSMRYKRASRVTGLVVPSTIRFRWIAIFGLDDELTARSEISWNIHTRMKFFG